MSENANKGSVPRVRSGVKNVTRDKTGNSKAAATRRRKSATNARRDRIRATVALPESRKRPYAMTSCINYAIAIPG